MGFLSLDCRLRQLCSKLFSIPCNHARPYRSTDEFQRRLRSTYRPLCPTMHGVCEMPRQTPFELKWPCLNGSINSSVGTPRRGGSSRQLWTPDEFGEVSPNGWAVTAIRVVQHIVFCVGPADGWSDAARKRAQLLLSLGPFTLAHALARLVVAEQIYRAFTILTGHPYHSGH